MITQLSNNKPSGTQEAGICDAGTPISGRTNAGRYQILRVNVDGSINIVSPANSTIYMGFNPTTIAVPPGAPPAFTFIGITNQTIFVGNDGVYRINPVYIYPGNAGGGISFILYKDFTNLGNYTNTLPPFNLYAPSPADISQGLYAYWHNTASQNIGAGLQTTYNRNNTQDVYLTTGQYNLAVVTEAGVVLTGGTSFIGLYEFTKVG